MSTKRAGLSSIGSEALSSLLAHPLRSFLTGLSVTFGAAVLFILLCYATGVPRTTADILRSLGSKEFIVEPRRARGPGGGGNRGGRMIRIRYSDIPAIRDACPSVSGLAAAYSPGRGGPVFGPDRSWPWARLMGVGHPYAAVTDMAITDGRWFTEREEQLAENVTLLSRPLVEGMFEGRPAIGKTVDNRGRRFKVIGVFESNSSFAYSMMVPYPTAMEMGDTGGRYVSHLAFEPRSPEAARSAVAEIREALAALYTFDAWDPGVLDVKENTAFVEKVESTSLALEAMVLAIAALTLILGCLGAANVVGIAVAERTAELGLRKALGATPGRIRAEVLMETLLLCVLGGALGVGLGAAAVAALGPLEFSEQASLVPNVDAKLLAVAFAILVTTAVLAGLPAAGRAARLDPVEALRS